MKKLFSKVVTNKKAKQSLIWTIHDYLINWGQGPFFVISNQLCPSSWLTNE